MPKCEVCGVGPLQGVTLYRANEKGVKGIWRCAAHPNAQSFTLANDPELNALEQAIKGKTKVTVQ